LGDTALKRARSSAASDPRQALYPTRIPFLNNRHPHQPKPKPHPQTHLLLGDPLQVLGQLQLVLLHQRGPHLVAARLVEGEDHPAADDQLVDLVEEGLDDGDLGGDLGAADDGAEGALGGGDGAVEVVQLLELRVGGCDGWL